MLKEDKKALRAVIKKKREALAPEYFKNAGEGIASAVISSDLFMSSRVIFAYISMKEEPDTRKIIETALEMGKTVCVPKCYGKGIMSAVVIRSYSELQPGMLNIPEPVNCENVMEESRIDLGIIPCVSANKKGQRIGHGAGYYDRFFKKTDCETICLCFEKLISEEIPMGAKDVLMDYVATENGLYKT